MKYALHSILLLLHFTVVAAWTPQMRESIDKTLICACVLRDPLVVVNRRKPLTTISPPFAPVPDSDGSVATEEEPSKKFTPYKYWSFYRKSSERTKAQSESYMDRFLSIFHHEPPTTTPSLQMQDDAPLYAPFAKLGRRIMDRYFDNFRSQWNFLDRFQCNCNGDLVDIPKAKSFITMRVIYD